MDINGATAAVTGASGGLGGAIARALHARGAHLILTGRREDALRSLASQFDGAEIVVCDLTDRAQLVALTSRLADADIVVASAASPGGGRLDDVTPEQLDRVLDVNLRAPMLMTQQLLPGMLRRGRGHFVYISSMAGKINDVQQSIYCTTKFGLRGFCGSLRQDLHGSGVSASVVFPEGIIDSGALADADPSAPPPFKGRSSEVVARSVIDAIQRDRGEVDSAALRVRVAGKLAGVAPDVLARLTMRRASRTSSQAT
jgi:short-subunit dehydrogenase